MPGKRDECAICCTDKPISAFVRCDTRNCTAKMCKECLSVMPYGEKKRFLRHMDRQTLFYICPFCQQESTFSVTNFTKADLLTLLEQIVYG
jgi:hypothetical protein